MDTPTSLGQHLQQRSAELARAWRSAGFVDGRERPTAALNGLVEGLIFELGRGLDHPAGSLCVAWSRVRGVLLRSAVRGEAELHGEFRRLAVVLDRTARAHGAADLERVRLRNAVAAAHK